MPRIAIPVVDLNTRGGAVIGATSSSPSEVNGDPVNDHFFSGNDGRIVLHARNTAGTNTVSLIPGVTVDGFTMPTRNVTVTPSQDKLIGPFPPSMFGETVSIDVDSANLRLRAYRLVGQPSRSPTPPVAVAAGSRVNIPMTVVTRAGIDITAGVSEVTADAANDHYFANDGNVILLVRATAADSFYDPRSAFTLDGQAVADFAAGIAFANPVEFAGPFPVRLYNQPDGNVYINAGANTLRFRGLWLPFQE